MNVYELEENNSISCRSSTGWLLKWYIPDKNIWVKTPGYIINWGGESYAEVLSSQVCKDFSIDNYVEYKPCIVIVNNTRILSCESKNFNKKDETFVSIDKLLRLNNRSNTYRGKEEYIRFIKTIKELTGLNIQKHIEDIILLDYIICNYDRNLWNIGLLYNPNGGIRTAPIFDNGNSFDLYRFQEGEFFRESLHTDSRTSKPFIDSFEKQLTLIQKKRLCDYTTNFKHTLNTLKVFEKSLSEEHNKFNIINPIPLRSILYIKTMITKNYTHLTSWRNNYEGDLGQT